MLAVRPKFLNPFPAALLSLALVGLTTLGLLRLQEWVTRLEGGHVHPYTIIFLLPIALLTILGGRRIGFLTLTLCWLSSLYVLTAPHYSFHIQHPSDWAELFFLAATGGILVLGMEALRRNLALFGETQEARARLQAVMDTSPIGILTCALDGTLEYANPQAERIWGHPFQPVNQHDWRQSRMLEPDGTPTPPGRTTLARVLAGEAPSLSRELIVERPDGTQVWVETTSTLVRDGGGEPIGGLVVMADITPRKRTEIEAERVRQREHTIATTLQDALRPRLPERVPGLDLKDFYRPALEEANVGGDFFDVFPLDKGLFALAVGDVSGKGLAAAAQVATVRNMLRYALYQRPTVAQAVTELNQVVSTQELLTGFATLFVGVYDTRTYEFTYASCGHEPGLVRRAGGGEVVEMLPTGPVLGASEQAVFEQRVMALHPGDAFVIYTDGVSEAGRTRRDFWGVDGLTALLQTEPPAVTAAALADHVISGAVAHAQGALHDDVCLLAGIVQSNGGLPPGTE